MSRTKRNVPFFKNPSENKDLIDRCSRGLCAMSMPYVMKSGKTGIDEVWGQDAKKFAKKQNVRALRRKNKKIEE